MKQSIKNLLRALYILSLTLLLTGAAFAAGPRATSAAQIQRIKDHEGFSPQAVWDYQQHSIGYGSNYDYAVELFPEIAQTGVITEEQADAVVRHMLSSRFEPLLNSFLDSYDITVTQNQYDALIDLTYNIPSWIAYVNEDDGTRCLLVRMLWDDPSTWTEERVNEAFGVWRTAGGVVIPTLVIIRADEARLFLTPDSETPEIIDPEPTDPDPVDPEPTDPEPTDPEPDPIVIPQEPQFTDVSPDKWYYPFVQGAVEKGLMGGMGGGIFQPEGQLTRAQLVQTLANFSGVDLSRFTWDTGYQDVAQGSWYAHAVAWGQATYLFDGGSARFGPDDVVDRQEMCVMLARYLSAMRTEPVRTVGAFRDDDQMNEIARSAVHYCADRGLIDGVGDGLVDPYGSVTRGQIAKILLKMDELANT